MGIVRAGDDSCNNAENKRQGVDDRALAGTVGTDDDIVFAKPDDRVLDSTEAVNAEREQFH